MESFQFAMFCLLVLMCFGEKLDEKAIREIETAHTSFLLYTRKLNVFSFVPGIAKYVFRRRWNTILQLRQKQKDLFVPLIRARKAYKEINHQQSEEQERFVHSYVDSLLDIKLADEGGRWLTEDEVVTLCSEFFTAGTDTTATALQWIMAELVKHQGVQARLLEEIESVAGRSGGDELKEEDLQRMPFLKAVIMEGLRRHPPGHFVLPHSVKEDIEFEGFLIPKKASVNFLVAEINWEGWERRNEARVHGCSALDDFSPQKIHFLKEEYMFDHGNRSLLFSKEQNSSRAPHSAIEDERLMRDAESAISLWAGWLVN